LLEAGELLTRGADERVGERVLAVAQAVDQNLGDEVLALAADRERTINVAALNGLEHLLDHFRFPIRVLADDEEQTLNHDRDGDERQQQNRPHDFFALDEKIHRGVVAEEEREGEALDDHRRKVV
jgi:hypothetical protein